MTASIVGDALTERQQSLLDFIVGFIRTNGYPPSIREMGAAMGIRSTNGVSDHVAALIKKGRLRRSANTQRGLVVVDDRVGTVDGDALDERAAALNALDDGPAIDRICRVVRATGRHVIEDFETDEAAAVVREANALLRSRR